MKNKILKLLALAILFVPTSIKAQDFFDTSDSERFFTLGARVGFNTSNRSFPDAGFNNKIFNAWGLGFNAGVVANINLKNYLTVQPGFFFESRSSNMINIVEYRPLFSNNEETYYAKLHQRAYYFTVPVMGVVHFNISDDVRWNVEFGPYLQFRLKETGAQKDAVLFNGPSVANISYAQSRGFDFGFKMGTGIEILRHYYVGVHYLAGVCRAWKYPAGGKNKSWMFTIGYDF